MKKIFLLAISLVFSVLLAGQALTVFAIGQTTDPIVIKNALRGNEYQRTMIIINTEKTDSQINFVASGEIGKWAEFYKLNDFQSPVSEATMRPGEALSVSVLFKVPSDTPNGEYEGFISAIKKANSVEEIKESSATVSQKIDRKVTIEVNDNEIILFKVSIIPKTYDLEEGEMLNIRLIYDNRGNTSISPQVQIKIKKDGQTVHNSIYPYPENLPLVKPGGIYEIPVIEIPTSKFERGEYLAELNFSIDEEKIVEKNFSFSIGNIVNKDNNNALSNFILRIGGGNTSLGLFFASGFLLLLSVFLIARMRKRV
ncbi:MAG: hypothetical protein KAI71_06235 [Candidatus Pacebacteria bacterium]|nr:hypothetical protein [Candidatus Paceibacterota bacterium]